MNRTPGPSAHRTQGELTAPSTSSRLGEPGPLSPLAPNRSAADCAAGLLQSNKTARLLTTSFAVALLCPFVAKAHPGHALGDHGVLHAVTSPYHLAVLALAGTSLWCAALWIEKKVARRTLQTLGVLAVLAAAALWGLRV